MTTITHEERAEWQREALLFKCGETDSRLVAALDSLEAARQANSGEVSK